MLTDRSCRAATCPQGKPRQRYTDAEGLYLEVSSTGSKRWFWKYYYAGKEKRLAIGLYPARSLRDARVIRDDARRVLQGGTDPVHQRQVDRLSKAMATESSFEGVAREFHRVKVPLWSEAHARRWLERLEKDVFPWLGRLSLEEVTAPVLLQTLRRVEARGVRETVHSIHQACGQVFRYGIATGRCSHNPAPDLRGALRPVLVTHQAAIVDPVQAGELMRAIHDYRGAQSTRTALVLSALLFQRPGNIRSMEWSEIDFEQAMWTIPAAKMKRAWHGKVNGRPHFVPLASQAIALLRDQHPLTGHGRFVFPGLQSHDRPMSENTVNVALRRLGYDKDTATAHGFRAMARTLLVERLGMSAEVIEAQLAHGKSGPLGSAYDRADYLTQRRDMMTAWADYLDNLRCPAEARPASPKTGGKRTRAQTSRSKGLPSSP